ncbi:hypothetical protein [Kineobactrum salinum]|uniref:Uncharacterized protein n=1 Tax=Kineobactrum salinum TaxID=2708301 RepID=A0A6C0U7P1_9GAMM|nr:hypothetical protein [Kineobactrum salinum]QIB65494.1 hypothetical protein G3T16_08850 [Kineobactrum salinum]
MRNLFYTLLLALVCSGPAALAADSDFPGIRKLMSEEEFRAAGLHRLSQEERAALNRWLVSYTVEEAPELLRSNQEVRKADESIRIEANIKPPFSGWTGDTLFHLDNGQVWQQRLRGRYFYNGDDTAVVIEKNLLGFYKMTLQASGRSVGVTRVR